MPPSTDRGLRQGPRTARARLESIPHSPMTPNMSINFPRSGSQEGALMYHTFSAPRRLSERALIPLEAAGKSHEELALASPLSQSASSAVDPWEKRRGLEQRRPFNPWRPSSGEESIETVHRPLSPLRLSPVRAARSPEKPSDSSQRLFSPLSQSPLTLSNSEARGDQSTMPRNLQQQPNTPIASTQHPSFSSIAETIKSPPQNIPAWPPRKAGLARQRHPHSQQMSVNSMRAHDGEDSDSEEEAIRRGALSPRKVLIASQAAQEGIDFPAHFTNGSGTSTPRTSIWAGPGPKCYMCMSSPCADNGIGLCSTCEMRFLRQDSQFSNTPSVHDSDYEDISVGSPDQTPDLSPHIPTKPAPAPTTPRSKRHTSRRNTATTASPHTPEAPQDGPAVMMPRLHDSTGTTASSSSFISLSASPTSYIAKQMQVIASPPFRRVSISTPVSPKVPGGRDEQRFAVSSALYHVMKTENWAPVKSSRQQRDAGHLGGNYNDGGRRVETRYKTEDVDTMKMLAGEGGDARLRHEAGGSFGDWFSHYAENEGDEGTIDRQGVTYTSGEDGENGGPKLSCDLFCSLPHRSSSGSSDYDRIQSIYDAYVDLPGVDEEEDYGMF